MPKKSTEPKTWITEKTKRFYPIFFKKTDEMIIRSLRLSIQNISGKKWKNSIKFKRFIQIQCPNGRTKKTQTRHVPNISREAEFSHSFGRKPLFPVHRIVQTLPSFGIAAIYQTKMNTQIFSLTNCEMVSRWNEKSDKSNGINYFVSYYVAMIFLDSCLLGTRRAQLLQNVLFSKYFL